MKLLRIHYIIDISKKANFLQIISNTICVTNNTTLLNRFSMFFRKYFLKCSSFSVNDINNVVVILLQYKYFKKLRQQISLFKNFNKDSFVIVAKNVKLITHFFVKYIKLLSETGFFLFSSSPFRRLYHAMTLISDRKSR